MTKTMRLKKIVKFYNETTQIEKCQLLYMMAKDIMVPVEIEGTVHCLELDDEVPICLNGTAFQINTEKLYENEKLKTNINSN